ncbi:hypothetical protein HanIR_Chr16g0809381 [Helianthus annuus]|nr:hypothetical protein HanIR_Chr16g0809381 [Helianthus annuus]
MSSIFSQHKNKKGNRGGVLYPKPVEQTHHRRLLCRRCERRRHPRSSVSHSLSL